MSFLRLSAPQASVSARSSAATTRRRGSGRSRIVDAGAAAAAQSLQSAISDSAGPGYPPGYVKDYDDGRPRH